MSSWVAVAARLERHGAFGYLKSLLHERPDQRQWQQIAAAPAAFVSEVLSRTLTLFDLPAV